MKNNKKSHQELDQNTLKSVSGGFYQGPLDLRTTTKETIALKNAGLLNASAKEKTEFLKREGFIKSK